MASLNVSINGPAIKNSYQSVINGSKPAPTASSTNAQWAVFSVQAPLSSAFQDASSKESVLKVHSRGEGELEELVEEFSEGRIQFAFVQVKDPNTGLPKHVLIAWCGGGVPERTKGYFTSHLAAVSKLFHGYHVQITARSENDLVPETIIQKVADASGAKYTAGGSAPIARAAAPLPVAKKPVFTPTATSATALAAVARSRKMVDDDDGWGSAPPVTRTEIEKVQPAYKPTKVNIAELRAQAQPPSQVAAPPQPSSRSDVVGGTYQPVGKVDITAIRAAAKNKTDDRPMPVKGAYEPVGKVDIAAIRARAQRPSDDKSAQSGPPPSVADRTAAFYKPAPAPAAARLTTLPKPKVANKLGASTPFATTKAPTPVGPFGVPAAPAAVPITGASRTFADQGGKTPAQLWAEKKAKQGGGLTPQLTASSHTSQPGTPPIAAQKTGNEWKSSYTGKTWAPVQTGAYGRGIRGHKTGDTMTSDSGDRPTSSAGGASAMRDRFKDAAPIAQAPPHASPPHYDEPDHAAPPPVPMGSRPGGGIQLPGLPSRPVPDEEKEAEIQGQQALRAEVGRSPSPPRVAVPVPRGPEPEIEPPFNSPYFLPIRPLEREVPHGDGLPAEKGTFDGRAAAVAAAVAGVGAAASVADDDHYAAAVSPAASGAGHTALIHYDYAKAEDNEIDLAEGQYVTNVEMVDDDWWMGTNAQGESGLFPSNYVELVQNDGQPAATARPEPEAPAAKAEAGRNVATALFDYEAAEDNELAFPEGARITNLEFPDEDWWFGHYNGDSGLFPANYVKLEE